MNLFSEIWTDPLNHVTEMVVILIVFVVLAFYLWYKGAKKSAVNG